MTLPQIPTTYDTSQRLPVEYALLDAGLHAPSQCALTADDELPNHVELIFSSTSSHLLACPVRVSHDEELVLKIENNETRRAVVKRDDDVLTPQQQTEHWGEIEQAMMKELQTWAKLQCFSRKPRREARNIIDTRWVLKFKWEEGTVDATVKNFKNSADTARKTIRARLTVRGFKDVDRFDIDRYAGTSTRGSQKLLVSEAVLRGWILCAADISKAFLQGVTYDELSELTGEPAREVNFYLPAYNVPQLRRIPGFESFDPLTEVLHCDKPGTGLVDAPRAFSLKLLKVTRDKCRLMPSAVDPELCMRHDDGVLTCIMSKHVDDLKFAGDAAVVSEGPS